MKRAVCIIVLIVTLCGFCACGESKKEKAERQQGEASKELRKGEFKPSPRQGW